MANVEFDRPRSMDPETLARELRRSSQCSGLEILLWDDAITIEDPRTGVEVTVRVERSRVEVSGGSRGQLADRVVKALTAQGLRRRSGARKSRPARGRRSAGPPPEHP